MFRDTNFMIGFELILLENEKKNVDQCKANDKTYNIGQTIEDTPNAFEKSSDFVFVMLPCDYSRNFLELLNNIQKVNAQIGNI